MSLWLSEYISKVAEGSVDPKAFAHEYLGKAKEDSYNSFVRTHDDYVSTHVEAFSDKRLAGAPIWVKDIFLTKGEITSCASEILQGYKSPYSATVMQKLEQAGWLMIGKTNMDEFAQWGSNENSYFWPVANPHDPTRVAGWSSGWSAAAVAADLCLWALGTDTGGSVRMPASLCGIVWVKPTYGRVSRYGIQAMSSSLDQAWVMTKNVQDSIILLDAISGYDNNDATSQDRTGEFGDQAEWTDIQANIKDKKIAVPKQFLGEWLDPRIRELFDQTLSKIKASGAQVQEIDLPILEYGIMTYYIINPAEVSANMARFDGIRFGLQDDTSAYGSLDEYYSKIRGKGFGAEVKRRIMIWAYVLSAGYFDAYYMKAIKVRAKMKQEMDTIFEEYDAIIWPTSPTPAWKLGEIVDDPVKNYLIDIYTVPANLCGIPAMSLPIGFVDEWESKLPVWFQIMSKHRDEKTMFEVALGVEEIVIGD